MTKEEAMKKTDNYLMDAIDLLAETFKKDRKKDKPQTRDAYNQLVKQDEDRCGFKRWKKL